MSNLTHSIINKRYDSNAAMTDNGINRILENTNTIEFGTDVDIIEEGTEIDLFYILIRVDVVGEYAETRRSLRLWP